MTQIDALTGKRAATLDLQRVERLIGDLEAELARADADEPGVQALREEVLTLRSMLDAPRVRHHWIAEGLQAIGDAAKAVRGEVVREGVSATEIARILGI